VKETRGSSGCPALEENAGPRVSRSQMAEVMDLCGRRTPAPKDNGGSRRVPEVGPGPRPGRGTPGGKVATHMAQRASEQARIRTASNSAVQADARPDDRTSRETQNEEHAHESGTIDYGEGAIGSEAARTHGQGRIVVDRPGAQFRATVWPRGSAVLGDTAPEVGLVPAIRQAQFRARAPANPVSIRLVFTVPSRGEPLTETVPAPAWPCSHGPVPGRGSVGLGVLCHQTSGTVRRSGGNRGNFSPERRKKRRKSRVPEAAGSTSYRVSPSRRHPTVF